MTQVNEPKELGEWRPSDPTGLGVLLKQVTQLSPPCLLLSRTFISPLFISPLLRRFQRALLGAT